MSAWQFSGKARVRKGVKCRAFRVNERKAVRDASVIESLASERSSVARGYSELIIEMMVNSSAPASCRMSYGPITIAIRARFEYDSSAIQHPTRSYVLSSNNEHVNSFALL